MKTKQEYIDTLVCITKEYYSTVRSPEEANKFNSYSRLFKELVDEHFEEKTETNYEHFEDKIIENYGFTFALVDGKPHKCACVSCSDCGFSTGHGCSEKIKEWLKQPYKKPVYKLTQFEYDLLNTFDRCKECCLLNEIECLKKLREKGYFNGIDPFTKVHEILDNCEVIK